MGPNIWYVQGHARKLHQANLLTALRKLCNFLGKSQITNGVIMAWLSARFEENQGFLYRNRMHLYGGALSLAVVVGTHPYFKGLKEADKAKRESACAELSARVSEITAVTPELRDNLTDLGVTISGPANGYHCNNL